MTLAYDVSGTGPTLLLLHSSVCGRRMWDPQWAPPADAGHRVVRCDFRGFGDSPAGERPYRRGRRPRPAGPRLERPGEVAGVITGFLRGGA